MVKSDDDLSARHGAATRARAALTPEGQGWKHGMVQSDGDLSARHGAATRARAALTPEVGQPATAQPRHSHGATTGVRSTWRPEVGQRPRRRRCPGDGATTAARMAWTPELGQRAGIGLVQFCALFSAEIVDVIVAEQSLFFLCC